MYILRHNILALLALTAANACTFGAYGVLSLAFNGYQVGRVGVMVAYRDGEYFGSFLAYSVPEFTSVFLVTVASAGAVSASWCGTRLRAYVLLWSAGLALMVVAGWLEALMVACLSGREVVLLCE